MMDRLPSLILSVVFIISTLQCAPLHADIINVPDDEETIQDGIDASEDGDTVLVAPGIYLENIVFSGKAITVGSLILTTENSAYIDSTVINGDTLDCCVSFEDREDENSVLRGFVLMNGLQDFGGGVDFQQGSSPVVKDCIIRENHAVTNGGGVYASIDAEPTLIRCVVEHNTSGNNGAGVSGLTDSHITIENSIIRNNEAESGGGGIWIEGDARFTLDHVLIEGNSAETAGGVYILGSHENHFRNVTIVNNTGSIEEIPGGLVISNWVGFEESPDLELINSIVWGNSNGQIYLTSREEESPTVLTVSYSNVEGGEDGVVDDGDNSEINWFDGNIDEDPEFFNVDEGDFSLTVGSPCIDAGDPDSPRDPDGTVADMGAFPFTNTSIVQGFVLDASNDDPIEGAEIRTTKHQEAITDTNGFWMIDPASYGNFDIAVSARGFNDMLVVDQSVDYDSTLEITVRFFHPEIRIDPELLEVEIVQEDTIVEEFAILNGGNGTLEWRTEVFDSDTLRGDDLELVASLMAGDSTDNERLNGVIFTDSLFYVSARQVDNDEAHKIYILTGEGSLVSDFDQPAQDDRNGFQDLAWDGEEEILWGTAEQTIYGLSLNGEVVAELEPEIGGRSSIQSIAWDPDREVLWFAAIVSNIMNVNVDGDQGQELSRQNRRVYGLAYWENAPDEYKLLIQHQPTNEPAVIYRMNPDNGDTIFGGVLEHPAGLDTEKGGISITNSYSPGSTHLLHLATAGSHDRIDIRYLSIGPWMRLIPNAGAVEAGDIGNVQVVFDSRKLQPVEFRGFIRLMHNALGEDKIIETRMTVLQDVEDKFPVMPLGFGLKSVYPNPFNSQLGITYALREKGDVEIGLFDLNGREVYQMQESDLKAGWHSATVSAGSLPSGVYLLKLSSGVEVSSRKIVLLK